METQCPIEHKILQTTGSRFILAKTRFPVEKHKDESGAWQQRVKLPITVATRAKSLRFQSSANEMENLSKVCQTIVTREPTFWSRRFSRPAKPAKPAVFGIGVNEIQIPILPSLPFSELVPIKHMKYDVFRYFFAFFDEMQHQSDYLYMMSAHLETMKD